MYSNYTMIIGQLSALMNPILNGINASVGNLVATEGKDKNYKIGINIKSDADCLKYIFSNDLKNFTSEADKIISNVELVQTTTAGYDVVITVKNRGYDTLVYKTAITVNNKRENTEEIYYVVAQYEYKKWNISISEPNVKPSNW